MSRYLSYLERRMERKRMREEMNRQDYRSDYRNPYGSQGGYVDSRMDYKDYNYGRDYNSTPRSHMPESYGRDYMQSSSYSRNSDGHYPYKQYGEHHRLPMEYEMRGIEEITAKPYYHNDYRNDYRDYRGEYNDYAKEGKEEYEKDLKKWIEKMKSKETKFKLSEEQVMQHAKNMGVDFKDFSEEEFYAMFLYNTIVHKNLGNEPMFFVRMTKDFFNYKENAVSPSEALCVMLYEVVLGDK